MSPSALRVGLIGAGPWADIFHAPMIAAGPETELAAVWARRSEAAERIVGVHGGTAAASIEQLLDLCDAVVFAVPPDVQAEYVVPCASAGKALLLEKPLGLTVAQAERVVGVIADTGVPTQLMLTNRYRRPVRTFLAESATRTPRGAIATFVTGAIREGGVFSTPWRVQKGALLDLGPHVLDLLDAGLGPIVEVRGAGDPRNWFALTAYHESGAISQATLSFTAPVERELAAIHLFTEEGELQIDLSGPSDPEVPAVIRAEFAQTAASRVPHHLNADRGLYLQRLIHQAEQSAEGRGFSARSTAKAP